MGFFDKLAKSFLGRQDAVTAKPDGDARESDSANAPAPFTPRSWQPFAPASAPASAAGGTHAAPEKLQPPHEECTDEFETPRANPFESGAAVASLHHTATAEVQSPQATPELAVAFEGAPPKIQTIETNASKNAAPFFDELSDDDFDKAFDDAFASFVNQRADADSNAETKSEGLLEDRAEVQDLFASIAANYARPVKNFIFELKRGTATKEWIEICRPAMHGIARAAEGMNFILAAQKMVDFEEALTLAESLPERVLRGEARDLLLSCYEDMERVMPQAFVIGEEEEQQREGVIINSLLKQIPDVGRVTIEKLYRAGLTSLDTLFLAKRDELAAATGIPAWLSERICEKFQSYRAELENDSRDVAHDGHRARLAELLDELRREHENFNRASDDSARAEEKREFRQRRQSCALRINVLLAEMGEIELVNELEKLSFDRRIRRLEEYLAASRAAM